MSTELRADDGSTGMTSLAHQRTNPKGKPPRRSLAILVALTLVALALIVLPRSSLYYPNVVVDAADGLQLNFLLNPRQDKAGCEAELASVVNAINASCSECRTRSSACIKNASANLRQRFDVTPLPLPSARMANGIVTYSAPTAKMALLACKESERQAVLHGDQAKVKCYQAGVARPHTAFEQRQEQAAHTVFTILLAIVGGLIATLSAAIFVAYVRNCRYLAHPISRSIGVPLLRSYPLLEKFTLAGVDTLILVGTFLAVSWPDTGDINRWNRFDRTTVIDQGFVIILTIVWFWLLLEHYRRRRPFWDELREIFRVLTVMFMVSGAAVFVAGLEVGRAGHLVVWALNFLLIPFGRTGVRLLLDDLGLWKRPAIIVGTGDNAREAYLAVKSELCMGYQVLGFVKSGAAYETPHDPSSRELRRHEELWIGNAEVFPIFLNSIDNTRSLELLLTSLGNPEIILALDSLTDQQNQILVRHVLASRTNVHVIPAIRGLPLFGTQLSHFFSHQVLLLTVRNNLARRGYRWLKRTIDLILASLLLVLLSPLFLGIALLIRRTGGTALYGHTRVGRNGKPFKCLKFRSMRLDADEILHDLLENDPVARTQWEKDFKLKDDPRVTDVGRFLRRTSLDELPQLFNVLKGEMSLVGPRPIVDAELPRYGDYAGLYLQVLPGITGLWQVSGRNDTNYVERVDLDAWYVQNWSPWYDVAILFRTIGVVLRKKGAY